MPKSIKATEQERKQGGTPRRSNQNANKTQGALLIGGKPGGVNNNSGKNPAKTLNNNPQNTTKQSSKQSSTQAAKQAKKPSANSTSAENLVKVAENLRALQKQRGRAKKAVQGKPSGFNGFVTNHKSQKHAPLKIIPLGGLNEIGKNLTVFWYGNDMIIVDCGLAFPDADMPGVDVVIPDFTFLEQNKDRIRGVFITHGHEDHIGSLAYLLKKITVPVYGTRLTLGLIKNKLVEHGLDRSTKLHEVTPRQVTKLGTLSVEFIRVNHSIPDACALAITTPVGVIVHTGDFKVDYTPIEGDIIDLPRLAELGTKGVLLLMSDSTNAERPGHTNSERTVGKSFERLFSRAENKRIIIATFSTNIHRVQQIIDCAEKTGR
jgi:ribonuclease J